MNVLAFAKSAAKFSGIALALVPCLASAQWWNPWSTVPPGRWAEAAPTFKYTQQIGEEAVRAINEAMVAGDTAKLDRMHEEFLAMLMKGGNGAQMIVTFAHYPEIDRARGATLFEQWRQRAPDSRLRPALEAAFHLSLAWDARGGGFAATVTEEGWRTFRAELDRAVKVLKEAGPEAKQSPLWYSNALSIAGARGDSPQLLDAMFDEGARAFPRFLPMYEARLNFLLPQWGGSYGAIDAFIRNAVVRTQATEGTWMYSTLYGEVFRGTRLGEDFFRKSGASWRLMRHSFEDKVATNALEDLNGYATFACIARDRETTARLLDQLGPKANLGVWGEGVSTETCIEFVKEGR